jgi:hypothetical protein
MTGLDKAGQRIASARTLTDVALHTVQYEIDQGNVHSEGSLSIEAQADHQLRVYGTANGQSIDVLASRDDSGNVRIRAITAIPSFNQVPSVRR